MSDLADAPITTEPIVLHKPKWFWRAILIAPKLEDPTFRRRLRFWWGMDIWFYRVPVLKTQAAVLIIAETARWLT